MIKVGIVGSEGYAVGELLSLLLNHPDVLLEVVYAPTRAGTKVSTLHPGLFDEREIAFTDEARLEDLDVLFLCVQGAEARAFLESHDLPSNLKVIDFSHEHRLEYSEGEAKRDSDFTYGMPECFRRDICSSHRVAVPGCFAISINLALIPLAKSLLLNDTIHIHSVAGKTEAAARPRTTAAQSYDAFFDHFRIHLPFSHPHLKEVRHTLTSIQKSFNQEINFLPFRGNFNRGIYTTVYTKTSLDIDLAREMYQEYYADHSFVRIIQDNYPDVRQINNTNLALIHLSKHEDYLLIATAMDNLLKGGAGTAVHLLNLMEGLVETTGLRVKGSSY